MLSLPDLPLHALPHAASERRGQLFDGGDEVEALDESEGSVPPDTESSDREFLHVFTNPTRSGHHITRVGAYLPET